MLSLRKAIRLSPLLLLGCDHLESRNLRFFFITQVFSLNMKNRSFHRIAHFLRELGTKFSMLNECILLVIWILWHCFICVLKLIDALSSVWLKIVLRILVTGLRIWRWWLVVIYIVLVGLRSWWSHLQTLWIVSHLLLCLNVRIIRTIACFRWIPECIDPAPSMHLIVAFLPIIQIIWGQIIELLVIYLLWIHISKICTRLSSAISLIWWIIRPTKGKWIPLLDIFFPRNIPINLWLLCTLITLLFKGLISDFFSEIWLHALVKIGSVVLHLMLNIGSSDIDSRFMISMPTAVLDELAWRTAHWY